MTKITRCKQLENKEKQLLKSIQKHENVLKVMLKSYVVREYGIRCKEYIDTCPICQARYAYDKLTITMWK